MNEIIKNGPKHVLVSRRDAIGDVILALPLCGLIKEYYPTCKISFLGRAYTRNIAMASIFVDDFLDSDDWEGKTDEQIIHGISIKNYDTILHLRPEKKIAVYAKKAGITQRIGTANRTYHWFTCNNLISLSRKNSQLHEAQLNIKLLKGLNINNAYERQTLTQYYGLKRLAKLKEEYSGLLSETKFNLILHPKSHGNSKEWSLANYSELINRLDPSVYHILISGSAAEKQLLSDWLAGHKSRVNDICGMFTSGQLVSFISMADGLVACSTGPLHIAAATGIYALGLYTDIKTKDGKRWGPIGEKAGYIECKNADMDTIKPEMVLKKVTLWKK